jgi:acyl-CoA reductase-like NAD-dependent aldehyde dehydrogenase
MIHLPILRWGEPYTSMDVDTVVHFATGEPIAQVSRATGGMIQRDARKAQRARDVLRDIPIDELIARVGRAGELYMTAALPMGDGAQTPDEFVHAQSASTGLPERIERMCRANMKKNAFVLGEMRSILAALTRGLALDVLGTGHGEESGVPISYQAQSPVLGLVLPSNSPGVHTLWMPIVPMQIGLVLKPGPQEPWTPYRMAAAFAEAGIPSEALSIYPGEADCGAAVLDSFARSLIFGGQPTVDRYRGNPRVQAHGPGFSKILFGDDQVDRWEQHLDMMVESVFVNSGRSCINCSGIWALPTRSRSGWPRFVRCRRNTPTRRWRHSRFPVWPRRSPSRSTPTCRRLASPTSVPGIVTSRGS